MRNSFSQTRWAREKHLSLAQLCSIFIQHSSGIRFGLSETDRREAKIWLEQKTQLWGKPISAIFDTMRSFEAAAPELIYRVRVGAGGPHGRKGELSPARFKAIVLPLAGEYELQRALVKIVTEENIIAPDAEILANLVATHLEDPEVIHQILLNPIQAIFREKQRRQSVSAPKPEPALPTTRPQLPIRPSPTNQSPRLESTPSLSPLWETNGLTPLEKQILMAMVRDGVSLGDVARRFTLTDIDLARHIGSIFKKLHQDWKNGRGR